MFPDDWLACLNFGLACKRAGDLPAAREAFVKSYALRPLTASDEIRASLLWNIGITSTAVKLWPQAAAAWRALGHTVGRRPDGSPSVPMGLAWVRHPDNTQAIGTRIDPARIEILDPPSAASSFRPGQVVVHDGTRVASAPHGAETLPVFPAL